MVNILHFQTAKDSQASCIEMHLHEDEVISNTDTRIAEVGPMALIEPARLSPDNTIDSPRSAPTGGNTNRVRFLKDLGYAGFGQTAVLATVLAMSNARTLLKAEYGISAFNEGLIAASLPFGMAVGQNVFGDYAVQLGAKRMGQIAACVSGAGTLLSSVQTFSVPNMIILSLLTGFGLGGEAPITNEICKEYVSENHVTKVLPLANNLGGVGEVLALIFIAATSALPGEQAWRAQLGFGALFALINVAARSTLHKSDSVNCDVTLKSENEHPLSTAENGNSSSQLSTDNEVLTLLPSYQRGAPQSTSPPQHDNLLNSRWTPLVLSSAAVCFLHEMVNNTITTYSPEFLDRESLFSVYSLACLANFASPYTLAYPQQGNGSCRITALGRHAGLARGLLFNASVYLTISLGKGSVWQESGQGENRALNFSTPLSKATFAGLFTMQQIVLAGYTAAGMYAFPSEAVPRHQSAEALGKVASMGKIGAIIGALVMPLLREKQGFESVMASCSASLFAASVISQLGLPVYNEEQVVKVQDNPDKLYSTLYGG